jgi:DNA-directed RNA polymerase specialized sigma24 family protein
LNNSQQKRDVLTLDELKSMLNNLSDAEWIRLGRASDALCWGLAIQGQDLLNEIFCRALEGKRNCPVDVPVVVFLIRAMESHVSAYLKKRSHDALEQAVMIDDGDPENSGIVVDLRSDMDTPEEILLAKQTVEKIVKSFSSDGKAQMVFMGQIGGLSPQEIQEVAGLSPVEYASTRRFIRRRLDKLDAEGLFK